MMKGINHVSRLWLAGAVLSFAVAGCDVDQTQEGELPDVDVEGGQLPRFDVEGPDVDVGTREERVTVPDVDVDVGSEERTITVPDVDIDLPNEGSAEPQE